MKCLKNPLVKVNFRRWTCVGIMCAYSDSSFTKSWIPSSWVCFINTFCIGALLYATMSHGSSIAFARGPTISSLASWRVLIREISYLMITRASYVSPESPHTPQLCKTLVGKHVGLLKSPNVSVSTHFNIIHNHLTVILIITGSNPLYCEMVS